jgi:hypothetical protein
MKAIAAARARTAAIAIRIERSFMIASCDSSYAAASLRVMTGVLRGGDFRHDSSRRAESSQRFVFKERVFSVRSVAKILNVFTTESAELTEVCLLEKRKGFSAW